MLRTASTENGIVRGLPADDPRITVYKGIPFAAPPVGDNRWRAPQPAENWTGERKCYEFGPISMQDQPGVGDDIYCREFHVDPDIPISEDCLYLNIWTGAKRTDEKLPVLVWIYGGAFQWGYTAEMEFNGERLARGGIIVVSVAYRLGVYGFLAHHDLTKEDPLHPTNFGLLDQQAALAWVYRNIASFGGDPENITLAGQSAGGASVSYALANPQSAGYVKRATIFSGLIRNPFYPDGIIMPRSILAMEENGRQFLEKLGCRTVQEARSVDAIKIREVYALYAKDHPRFVPCIDGVLLKEDPYDMYLAGTMPDIPLMTGYTKDEFMDNVPAGFSANADKDSMILADVFDRNGRSVINIVQNTVRIIASARVKNNTKSPTYTYKFAPSIPGPDDPGCFHSCDLWFFFENVPKCWRPYDGSHYALSKRMSGHWINFIRTGDPNGIGYDGKTLPVWSKCSSEDTSADEMIFTEALPPQA